MCMGILPVYMFVHLVHSWVPKEMLDPMGMGLAVLLGTKPRSHGRVVMV